MEESQSTTTENNTSDDLEEQCEDAVFAVCDARERYPAACADELAQCMKLSHELEVKKLHSKPSQPLEIFSVSKDQQDLLETYCINSNYPTVLSPNYQSDRLGRILNRIENLKDIIEQLESDRVIEINML